MNDPAIAPNQMVSEQTRLLLEARIAPTLLRLAAPNIVINLVWIAVNPTIDAYLGGALSPEALAGLSLVFPIAMLMQQMANAGMSTSVGSAVARALGAGQPDEANRMAVHGLVVGAAMAAVFTVFGLAACPAVFRAMGGRGEVLEAAVAYSSVLLGGSVCLWMLCSLAAIIRGTGQFMFLTFTVVAAELAHIALAPALVFGWGGMPRLGVAGAAAGTVLSFGIGALAIALYLRSGLSPVRLVLRGVQFRRDYFWEIIKVGAPSVINVSAMNLAVTLFTSYVAGFGAPALAAYGAAVRLEYAQFPLIFGFGVGAVAMVATSIGADRLTRAERVGWVSTAVAALITGAVGVTALAFPGAWTGLFTRVPDVAALGALYLRTVAPAYPFLGASLASPC
jgi:putative MATE family efflux protein